jgi:AraC-like DNA-binding protein
VNVVDAKLGSLAPAMRDGKKQTIQIQRRLAEEGVSYQKLLDGARKQAAGQYLSESSLAIGEVAYPVDFSEPAAFHRAFKRWFGLTLNGFGARVRSHPHRESARAVRDGPLAFTRFIELTTAGAVDGTGQRRPVSR